MLALVFSATVLVRYFAHLVRLEENNLGDPFIGVDLRRKRSRVGKFQRDVPLPLGLEGGDIDNDAAAGISGFSQADSEDIAGNAKIFDSARKREGIGRNKADVAFYIYKGI